MKSIVYVGMDVHKDSYTLCCYRHDYGEVFAIHKMTGEHQNILKYLARVREEVGYDCDFICGYEAGSLGFSLYHQLTDKGVKCIVIAPTSIPQEKRKRIKTDKRDAIRIAEALAFNTYKSVNMPTVEDEAVKEYIRMRCAQKRALKKIKQQILAFCTRHGKKFTDGRSNWTGIHLAWLSKLDFDNDLLKETLSEQLVSYYEAVNKLALFDKRIEAIAQSERYRDDVKRLLCFLGIRTHTALSLIVEVGDFKRFRNARHFAAYLGLVPGETSSGESIQRTGITKAGNSHLRRLMIEAAQCYSRGALGKKSKTLLLKQAGNNPRVIAYADKAIDRMRRKFYRLSFRTKRNIIVTAIARELACFAWGMMTASF